MDLLVYGLVDLRSGMGNNSSYCSGRKHCVHKKWSGILGRLVEDKDFECDRRHGLARFIEASPFDSITLEEHTKEVAEMFCYLGDTFSAGGGDKPGTNSQSYRAAFGMFRELTLRLSNRYIHIKIREKIFHVCLRSVLLYGSDSWVLRKDNKVQLARIGQGMKGQESYICIFVTYVTIPSSS